MPMLLDRGRQFLVAIVLAAIGGSGLGLLVHSAEANSERSPLESELYPINDRGMTYGSALLASMPSEEPDLILVVATNGREGYAKQADLAAAEGSGFSSPQEALAWQEANEGATFEVPVYKSDGVTRIGVFIVGDQLEGSEASHPSVMRGSPGSNDGP